MKHNAPRIDRLLRSLVGVADLRLLWDAAASLRVVHILRTPDVQEHQLVRNIVSGLRAGFGIRLDPAHVCVHADAAIFGDVAPAHDPDTSAPATNGGSAHAPAGGNGHGNGNGNAQHGNGNGQHGNGNGNGNARPVPHATDVSARETAADTASGEPRAQARPRPPGEAARLLARAQRAGAAAGDDAATGVQLERVDIERYTASVRCRVVLKLDGRRCSAVAEAADSPAVEAELAARVALDALRAGGLSAATLEGVTFLTIAGTNYVATAVRAAGEPLPRASAAPYIDGIAWSAAAAVLAAAGSALTTIAPVPLPRAAARAPST